MEKRPDAVLLKFPGTNCDAETARALEVAGFGVETLPFNLAEPERFLRSQLVVLAGGFSYGDYIMAGRLAQLEITRKLGDTLHRFKQQGGCILGICNGFQILMRLGLLPEGSLVNNANRRFICRWVRLRSLKSDSPYLSQLPASFELPIAHAEGRFFATPEQAAGYVKTKQASLLYEENVNGSVESIAGLGDESGRVFGLMPHPERFLYRRDHYDPEFKGQGEWGWGYYFFRSIHDYLKSNAQ